MNYIKERIPLLIEIISLLGIAVFSDVVHYNFPRKLMFTICIIAALVTEYYRGNKNA